MADCEVPTEEYYSALIEDLHDRSLLDDTMVTTLSEFGRTPKVNPAGGRDHWPQCFTCSFAGGGVKGGRVVGKSDPIGGFPAERPVEPGDVVATVFHSLGLDPKATLPGPSGRPSLSSISATNRSRNCSHESTSVLESTHLGVVCRCQRSAAEFSA